VSNYRANFARGKRKRGQRPKRKHVHFPQGRLDVLETPDDATAALLQFVDLGRRVLEPAAGSGRMVRFLRSRGHVVERGDIRTGQDFLKRTRRAEGDTVTNPPYSRGRAEAFARKALELTDGKVAMLMDQGFVWGQKRSARLWRQHKPYLVVVIPWRIYFFKPNGRPIDGQANEHCWIVWPKRSQRGRNRGTHIVWARQED